MTPPGSLSGTPRINQSRVPGQFYEIKVGLMVGPVLLLKDLDPKSTVLDLIKKAVKEGELDDTQDYIIIFAGKRMQDHYCLDEFLRGDKDTGVLLRSKKVSDEKNCIVS